ncbi:hypothetical protein O181_102998 [Austropuccinia psidii MF-1]|uniref:3'-5' exonuclease domain-containing protein n=1 Tax=Austropuccinia psidii MF-1 TaxID=1389203 RepID=A0A9Q3PIN3_9BASI|nr:hypothetical protein [Austropuccinia psidii MF-1]
MSSLIPFDESCHPSSLPAPSGSSTVPLGSQPNQNQPGAGRRHIDKNQMIIQILKEKSASRGHSSSDPNRNHPVNDDGVIKFDAFKSHSVRVFPLSHNASFDGVLQRLINNIIADGFTIYDKSSKSSQKMIAFDMEWDHDFRFRKPRPTSIIQVAGKTKVLVIKLAALPTWHQRILPNSIFDLLSSTDVIKFGVGISGDARKLSQDRFFTQSGYHVYLSAIMELNHVVKSVDEIAMLEIESGIYSLQRLVCRYLEEFLYKPAVWRSSNWEAVELSKNQLDYAAADVAAAIRVYQKLLLLPGYDKNFIPPITYWDPRQFQAKSRSKSRKSKAQKPPPQVV